MAQNNRAVGTEYEEKAEAFLCGKGMKILFKNFRCKQGEIDIVGEHQGCLVFVEVKYRSSKQVGMPEEAVGTSKQRRICRVAEFFLYTHPYYANRMIRYDVVAIYGEDIRWYPAAFEHIN